jgi:hypothetical protein
LNSVSPEVVHEVVLADLPIFLEDKACMMTKDGGESWWYVVCDCNDQYLGVVEEIVSMCTYQQVHELCFMTRGDTDESLVSCASPECGEFLRVSLLFVGRFELLGSSYSAPDAAKDMKTFDALDYGTEDSPFEEGRRVTLNCYAREDTYKKEVSAI